MGLSLNTKKISLKLLLNEIFNSPAFKTEFDFVKNSAGEVSTQFEDPKNNNVKIYFHQIVKDLYEIDFTINGNSYKADNIEYGIKDYTSLIATVAKATSQFLKEFKPKGVKVDGQDALDKIIKTGGNQKNNIYNYFIHSMDEDENYGINYKENGNFELVRKNK